MATCNPCVSLPCANQGDLKVYSLQSGIQFSSSTISVIVNCPAGSTCVGFPKTVTYPPGTFTYNLPDPNPPEGTVLRMNGCLGAVTRIVPADATAAEIAALVQEIIQEVAEQQAYCDTIESNPPPSTPVLNDAQSQVIDCDEGEGTVFTGTLPSYITLDGQTNTFTIKAGIFAGNSKSEANSNAVAFLAAWIVEHEAEIECQGCEIIVVAIGPPTEGQPYSQVIAQTGFSTPFWSISAGALPPGLTINSSTGEIAGTPTTPGPYTFTVRAAYEEGSDVYCEHEFSFTVVALFADLVWTEDLFTLAGTASGSWTPGNGGFGEEFTMEGIAPDTAGSSCIIQTQANMSYVGTGSIVPCKISLTVSNANGQLPDASRAFVVRIPQFGAIVASISDANSKVDGSYSATFNLPATNTTVQIEADIHVAQQVATTSRLTWVGSIEYDAP